MPVEIAPIVRETALPAYEIARFLEDRCTARIKPVNARARKNHFY
jgi:hypothetical protein